MPHALDQSLLDALLDSWDRNNAITVNLLRAIPDGGLAVRAMEGSKSVGEMFKHMNFVRLLFVQKDAPEVAVEMPKKEWAIEGDANRMAEWLNQSARAVRDAVRGRLEAGREMDVHYDHPILMLQHLIWHEGYHHGQIKLALKLSGRPLSDDEVGTVTWDLWMKKAEPPRRPAS